MRIRRVRLVSAQPLHLLRIRQDDLRVCRFLQHVEDRPPILPCALHHDVRATALDQPLTQSLQALVRGLEFANLRLRIPIGRPSQHTHRDPLLTDIDAGTALQHCGNHIRLLPESAGRRLQLHKLFREPKLNLGYVQRQPDQVHHRGLRHHYTERSLRSGDSSIPPLRPPFS